MNQRIPTLKLIHTSRIKVHLGGSPNLWRSFGDHNKILVAKVMNISGKLSRRLRENHRKIQKTLPGRDAIN